MGTELMQHKGVELMQHMGTECIQAVIKTAFSAILCQSQCFHTYHWVSARYCSARARGVVSTLAENLMAPAVTTVTIE